MRAPRFLSTAAVILGVLVAASKAAAQVTITPAGGTWPAGTHVNVTVEVCVNPDNQWEPPQSLSYSGDMVTQWTEHTGSRYTTCYGTMSVWDSATVVIGQYGGYVNVEYFTSYWQQGQWQWNSDWSGSASFSAAPTAPVVVPIEGGPVVPPTNGITTRFRVTAAAAGTHTFSATCTAVASPPTCTSVVPASATLAVGDSVDVAVTYNVAGNPLDTGRVTLTATNGTVGSASVLARIAPVGLLIARDQCLTVAVGPDAAMECGDLRVIHPLPAVRAGNRLRVPTLLYNSQHARPTPIVYANIVTGAARPDSVVATLHVAGLQATGRWTQASFPANSTRRIGVALDASSMATGIYANTMEMWRWAGGQYTYTVQVGRVAIVNRAASPFGAGWWLAGLEQILFPPDGSLVWVGGDGGLREYVSVGTNTWITRPVERQDTIRFRADAGEYVHVLATGDSIVFDQWGHHKRTVNIRAETTYFLVSPSTGALVTLQVASPFGPTYYFAYDGGNHLYEVSGGRRPGSTTITNAGGRIVSILDFGATTAVTFGYTGNLMTSRTDRRGVPTTYEYDSAYRLRASRLPLGTTPADTIVRTFVVAGSRGVASDDALAVAPESVFTRVDGPRRPPVSDVMTFWHDEFGGVAQVRDALGSVTTISRGDPRWPGLPTRVRSPRGHVVLATYDGRVDMMITTMPSVIAAVRNGLLRAVAVTGESRSPLFPDLPTFTEAGVPGYVAVIHYGMVAPARLDRASGERLNAALNAALADPQIRARIADEGGEPLPGTRERQAGDIDAEETKWGALVRQLGIKVE